MRLFKGLVIGNIWGGIYGFVVVSFFCKMSNLPILKNKNLIVLFLFFFCFCSRTWAVDLPAGQDAAAQAERYRYNVENQKKILEYKKPKGLKIGPEKEKVKPVSKGPSFLLNGVNVTGSSVFKPEDFRKIYGLYLKRQVTFQDMQEVAGKIESKYKQEGYYTTTVYIPQQNIQNGVIEIRVAEGEMGNLSIEGNRWFSADFIKRFIHVNRGEILNIKKLARDILRLNKNPDLQVKVVLSQGRVAQTTDISLKVEGRRPWHVGVQVDNSGTRLTGKVRPMLFTRSSNVSGRGDMIFINSLYTGDSLGESVSYSVPVGTNGTKFGLDVTYFRLKVGKEFKSFNITGVSQIYTPHLSWELALTEDFEAYYDLGINIKSINKKQAGTVTDNGQMRIPYFAFDFIKTDSEGVTTFSPKFDFGTSGFWGSSRRNYSPSSRANTGGSFFKYQQSLNRTQKMFFDSYVTIRTQLQLASHTLAPSEQLQLGGADSIRGYPEGDYSADNGGYMNFDWFFPSYVIPETWKLPGQEAPLRRQIQPVFFVDLGGGKLKETQSGETKDKFLAGIGGGLSMNFKSFSLRLDWAKSIGDKQSSGSGPSTFYFTFRSEI
ncbi:MAG: ShlB/FhaC/HecB family hemolysin secretion/activation protein [Candidatus Omnitrophica bacterium]|nr:ShlB/FhaC/HecB family hemolysin secretion/activation protein [Candidatus Omnitrophota bacterium]